MRPCPAAPCWRLAVAVLSLALAGRVPADRVPQQPTGGVAQQVHHLLESHSRTAQALWMEPQAQWMPSVHRKEVPRPAVRPSSPQEEPHRQQTHHLFEPRSRATQVLPQQLQAQQRHSAHHKDVPRLAVCPSRPQEELRRRQTHHLLESHSRTAQVL